MSKDPKSRVLGPKYRYFYSIWALKPYYLGPWTLGLDFLAPTLNRKPWVQGVGEGLGFWGLVLLAAIHGRGTAVDVVSGTARDLGGCQNDGPFWWYPKY